MKRFAALFGAFALLAAPALAIPVTQAPGYAICLLTTTAVTVCSAPGSTLRATFLYGVFNNSATAQTASVTCWDSPAAAAGVVALALGQLGVDQIVTWPAPGKPLAFGLVCQASAAIVGSGVEIYVR